MTYGKDEQGRLLHNFGPLNRRGGERRLNVAATRAKSNVQLVSSMHAGDIDLKRTSAEGARLLREYLDFAENGEEALQRSITVGSDDQFDSDFELEVCEFLREKGYVVDTQVGCSGYRIDLGLKKPNSSDYLMAIECDGAAYAALAKVFPQINPSVRQVNIPLYYKDFNTNRNFDLYPHLENGKEITLRILHLLSAINFVRFVIRAMIPVENPWQLRIKYITLYYVWKSIEKIESTFKNEGRLHSLLDSIDGSSLLNAAFRSCMTHYGLSNKDQCAIKDECFDPNIPLFGLVESCYGMSYLALNSKIDAAIDSISDTLADRLPFDFSGLKAL